MHRIEVNVATGQAESIPLTPEEIAEAQARTAAENALTPDKIKLRIAHKERDAQMPRAVREFMLTNLTPEQIASNPGYQKIKALDDEIKELRNQL